MDSPRSEKMLMYSGLIGTSFLALSLVEAGYEVFANTDASGTFTDKLAFDANRRMEKAGVTLMGMFALTMDLMRDWYVIFLALVSWRRKESGDQD